MPRFKPYSYAQTKMIPIDFSRQIQPGTFELALNQIIDEMDLSTFDHRFHNDQTGAPAYDPAILLKIVLFAYSRGIVSSREIARACEENVVFMALAADTRPHFTTIADFIARMGTEIAGVFRDVLTVCYTEGLIGRTMFAIDGCKISSNCSKERCRCVPDRREERTDKLAPRPNWSRKPTRSNARSRTWWVAIGRRMSVVNAPPRGRQRRRP